MFDVINNRECPFCRKPMVSVNAAHNGANSFGYYQCGLHLEVGYYNHPAESDNLVWAVIRVSPIVGKPIFSVWHGTHMATIDLNKDMKNTDEILTIPSFPMFDYTLHQLADKLITYLVFS